MNGLSNATETIQQITQHAGNPHSWLGEGDSCRRRHRGADFNSANTAHKSYMGMITTFLAIIAFVGSVPAYNSLAPHDNTENTDFWDTRGYDVAPVSSASGVCVTPVNRLSRTEAESINLVRDFHRLRPVSITISFR